MKNLDTALTGKKLTDLQADKLVGGSNLVEPTKVEIEAIMSALKAGMSPSEIKKTIRRWEKDGSPLPQIEVDVILALSDEQRKAQKPERAAQKITAKGFSSEQINLINEARLKKIAELIPTPKEITL